MIKTDVLVIGSGISGLSYAIKISEQLPDAKITIVTKAEEDETNTKYAQGGLAVVTDFSKDNFEKHIEDTMRAGDGENNREVVEMVIKEGPDRFRELVDWGTRFDKKEDGEYKLGEKAGIQNSELYTTKTLLVLKLNERC
jgi:L-aspartate oxidase